MKNKLNNTSPQCFFLFIAILFFPIAEKINSQISPLRFEHLKIENGLSQSSVRAIHQDKKGFMWFGTNDGLNRYDGYEFKIFKNNPYDTTTISSNYILDISEDDDRYLWIATANGLNRYSHTRESFTPFNFLDRIPTIDFSNSIISVIAYNNPESKVIWFTNRNGVFKYDLEQDYLSYFAIKFNEKYNKIDKKIFLHRDYNDDIWAVTNMDGIYKFNAAGNEFDKVDQFDGETDIQMTAIYEDKNNNFWFGSLKGLNFFNPATGEVKHYKYLFEREIGKKINTGFINRITEDNKNNLWLATSGYGLISFNKTTEEINVYKHDPFDENTISLDVVHTLFKDRSGIIWIGTDGNGIDKLSPYYNNFVLTRRSPAGLSINSVRTFFEDAKGYLWISGYTGLDRYNPETSRYKSFFSDTGTNSTKYLNEIVYTIIEDKNEPGKYLYFGTEGSGVYRFDLQKESFNRIYYSNINPGDNIILSLLDDGEGNIWIGTNNGLVKLNEESGKYKRFIHNPSDSGSVGAQRITAIFEDSYGNFWVGTDQDGLNLMDKGNETFTSYNIIPSSNNQKQTSDSLRRSSIGVFVKCIYEDNNTNLWIGTTTGLSKFNRETKSFKTYTIDNGLPNNVIYGILEDEAGNLWFSTNKGLSKFNPYNETFKNYDYMDGLQGNEFNTNAYYKNREGKMFFGGINGFNSFFSDEIKENSSIPQIVITGFRLFNKPVNLGAEINGRVILKKSIETTDIIELEYKENVFTIEFASMDYAAPSKNLYSYKLEGFNNIWSEPVTQRTVTYTNLDPGEYVFRVICSNNDGIWNDKGTQLTIVVDPPFYLTWWFFTLGILIIAGTLYSFYRIKVAKIVEMERLRTKIASDLHDDIGATLTKISMQAELMQQGIDKEDRTQNLAKISEMSRNVISTMQDVVWSIDSRNDSIKDLLYKMKDFSFNLLRDKNIQVNFNTNISSLDQKLPVDVRQNLFLILKEAVNNIAKHSNATEVDIELKEEKSRLSLIISDNGANCKIKEFSVGHGLKNMKMRAEKIKADIQYEQKEGFTIKIENVKLS